MKIITALGVSMALAASSHLAQGADAQPATAAPGSCSPAADLRFVCGLANVEDFVPVAGGRWLVGGSLKVGSAGLYLIDTTAKTARAVALSIASEPVRMYGNCTAPDLRGLSTHGLDVVTVGGAATVYVVNHGGRESVEVFRLDTARGAAEWVGCVILPEGASGNAVAALPDGSFFVSKFTDTRDKNAMQRVMAGEINGVVYLWKPGVGFSEVPGTRLSGDNGLVVSADHRWLFVNAYGTREIYRVPLTGAGASAHVQVAFSPDNLRWTPDGKLFVTGQFLKSAALGDPHAWETIRLDPKDMSTASVVKEAGLAEFADATSTVQVGQTLWFGTFRGDRVAYRSAPTRTR